MDLCSGCSDDASRKSPRLKSRDEHNSLASRSSSVGDVHRTTRSAVRSAKQSARNTRRTSLGRSSSAVIFMLGVGNSARFGCIKGRSKLPQRPVNQNARSKMAQVDARNGPQLGTRKPCYRKGDRAMRRIGLYGCAGQFGKPLATPMVTIHSRPNRRNRRAY